MHARQWLSRLFNKPELRIKSMNFPEQVIDVRKKLKIAAPFFSRRAMPYHELEDQLIMRWSGEEKDKFIAFGLRRGRRAIQQRRYKLKKLEADKMPMPRVKNSGLDATWNTVK